MFKVRTLFSQLSGLSRLCGLRTLSVSSPSFGLVDQLTPELKESLVGNFTSKKFKLEMICEKLTEFEEINFPLPEKLTDDQWKMLISFENYETWAHYLNQLAVEGEVSEEFIQKLREDDKEIYGPLVLDPKIVEELVGNDASKMQTLEQIEKVHENMLVDGYRVVRHIPKASLADLLQNGSNSKIASCFHYLRTVKNEKFGQWVKRRAKDWVRPDALVEHYKKIADEKHLYYGLGNNTIFLRLSSRALEQQDDFRVINEFHEWGQPLVIDLSFVKDLPLKNVKSLFFREMPAGLKYNRQRPSPFAIYFTSFDPNCSKCALLEKAVPRILKDPAFPAIVSEKSYLDLFPQKDLLYLSPDSRNDYLKFNPNDVFVIGGIVDAPFRNQSTLAEAKKQNIRHARFPTKRFVGMKLELNVDTAIGVIAEFKNSRDWLHAFRWLPPRKLRNRLRGESYTKEMEAVYHAHHALCPTSSSEFERMGAREYRRRFKQIVERFKLDHADEPDVKVFNDKYRNKGRDVRYQNKYGFLDRL